jgi:hypothetical protein
MIRAIKTVSLDASGNISTQVRIQDVENEARYVYLQALFTEVRVESLKSTFYPSTAIRTTNIQLGVLFAAVVHNDYTALQVLNDQLRQVSNAKFSCMAAPKPVTQVWRITPGDAEEENFYSCQGTSIAKLIPRSLGGVVFWCDGPVSAAATYIGDIVSEWQLTYRGSRAA